jgi:hypothetical protein
VTVTIVVRNRGPGDAQGIQLEDSFDPRDFAGVGDEFRTYRGQVNDQRLLWSRLIPSLSAGTSVTVEYTVNALLAVWSTSLPGTTASIGGKLVGVSNKISLPDSR